MSYDGTRQMVSIKGVSINNLDGNENKIRIIEDLSKGITYIFDEQTKQYFVFQVNFLFSFDFEFVKWFVWKETSKYLYSSAYKLTNEEILCDTWLIEINNFINYLTVSRDNCFPLFDYTIEKSQHERILVESLTTTNFVKKIEKTVFDLPVQCKSLIEK